MRNDKEVDKIWFSSDLHFLHPKIIDICNRPTTIEEHDEWLLDRINSKVKKNDTFYMLGDVSLGSKEKTEKILDKMNGNKILILGNHDKNIEHSTRFKEIKQMKNFNFHSESHKNIHIILCHYPLATWDRIMYGSYHLFGHCHGRMNGIGNSFDIGVDCNDWYPLSLREVLIKLGR